MTDHAVLRWLERVHQIDVELFRNEIEEIAGPAAAVGASALKKDGFVYVIRSGAVITITPDDR